MTLVLVITLIVTWFLILYFKRSVIADAVAEIIECSVCKTMFSGIWNDLSVWSQETFGSDIERDYTGPLKHLKLEVDEALESGEIEEFADCLLLLMDAARRRGLAPAEFLLSAHYKLQTCKTRYYPKPKNGEPSQHE